MSDYWRVSGVFLITGLIGGCLQPYWPTWLESRGLTDVEIGWILSAIFIVSAIAVPFSGFVGALLSPRRLILLGGLIGGTGYAAIQIAEPLLPIVGLSIVGAIAFAMATQGREVLGLLGDQSGRFSYSRVRAWVPVGYGLANLGGGVLLGMAGVSMVPILVVGLFLFLAVSVLVLPDRDKAPSRKPVRWRDLPFGKGAFVAALVALCLIQSSHAVYYAFFSIDQLDAGHDPTLIGGLWLVSQGTEVLFFMVIGTWLAPRIGARGLFLLAAVAALVRWSLVTFADDPLSLAVLQGLHAFSFGASLLAGARVVASMSEGPALSLAQGVMHGAWLMAIAAVSAVAGMLRDTWLDGYAAMAFLAFLAVPVSLVLGVPNCRPADDQRPA